MRESSFQSNAINFLENKGAYVLKTHVSSYQSQGEPDLTCCYKGFYIAFELKVKGNKPSPLQEKKLEKIRRAGGIAIGAYSIEEIEEALKRIDNMLH